jgi:hypothetical protein
MTLQSCIEDAVDKLVLGKCFEDENHNMSNKQGLFSLGWKQYLLCFLTAPQVTWVDIAENLLSQRKSKSERVVTGFYLTYKAN